MRWMISHIFDGEYGCEEDTFEHGEPVVSVTLENEAGEKRYESVTEAWLTENGLDVGSEWPDYSGVVLETRDLILKKAALSDWKDIYEKLWRYAESARYMNWSVTESEQDAISRMERTIDFQKNHKYILFVYEKGTQKAIGFAGMRLIEPGVFEETGIALGPSYIERGYGTQILQALVDEAKRCGAHTFLASNRKQNAISRHVQEKCGFVFSWEEALTDQRTGETYILEHNRLDLA